MEGVSMKKWLLLFISLAIVSLLSLPLAARCQQGHMPKHGTGNTIAAAALSTQTFPPMPGPGKKVPIGGDQYLIYGFDKKPKLGMIILKVEVFTKDGKKDTSFEIKGDAGMPSMKGAHETGDQPFKLSKKGDYLLPINIVMPGDWEIRLTLSKGGKVLFTGSYQFDV
jgi:hypothetical protein